MKACGSIVISFLFCTLTLIAAGAQGKSISVDEAVKLSLASDARAESSNWDWLASTAKAEEAKRRQLPALSLSAGYTRLSDLTSTMSFGSYEIPVKSLDNVYTFAANMQYPVFAGFRLQEAVNLAELQSHEKKIGADLIKRAIAFETQRAYWEAVRSELNVRLLQENLGLMKSDRDVTKEQFAQGTAMNADLLSAEMRCDQAEMDLENAQTAQRRVYTNLALLVSGGADSALPADAASFFSFSSKPEGPTAIDSVIPPTEGAIDETALVAKALERRPETRAADLSVSIAESNRKLSEAPLYPTLNLTGNYTYADPNQRVAFQTDPNTFTGTWSLGVSLSYDLGGLPANISARQAQIEGVKKSIADGKRQREVIILDVRNCTLAYEQIRKDVAHVSRMIEPAMENERVARQRVQAGSANENDLLAAEIARLRSEFAVSNKQIDLQIAAADLCRAAALADIE